MPKLRCQPKTPWNHWKSVFKTARKNKKTHSAPAQGAVDVVLAASCVEVRVFVRSEFKFRRNLMQPEKLQGTECKSSLPSEHTYQKLSTQTVKLNCRSEAVRFAYHTTLPPNERVEKSGRRTRQKGCLSNSNYWVVKKTGKGRPNRLSGRTRGLFRRCCPRKNSSGI